MWICRINVFQKLSAFIKSCLCIVAAIVLAFGGFMMNPVPAYAVLDITPSPLNANLTECEPYSVTFSPVGQTCPTGPFIYFYWLSGAPPSWVSLDMTTGELTACPPIGSAGVYNFGVGVTELWMGPVPPPCAASSPVSNVTLTVAAAPVPAPLTILPTYYYTWSMEGMPFYLPLSAIGCSGNYTWSASGLPVGLSVTDPAGGVISGIPAYGSSGVYTVTVNVKDNILCDNCCPPASRPFLLVIDSYAAYIASIVYTSYYDFMVQIGPGLSSGITGVMIDGAYEASLMGNQSDSFNSYQGEAHLVMVDEIVAGADPRTRYSVIGTNQILVNELNSLAYFDYVKEVLIETESEPPAISRPPGTGFYPIGEIFTAIAQGPEVSGSQQDTKYIFKEWILPDGSVNSNRDMAFIVSYTGKAVAKYDTYYKLTIESTYPGYSETTWELKDSLADWDVALQPVPMPGFWGMIGGVMKPVNTSGSQMMTGPHTEKIEWYLDYTVPVVVIVLVLLVIAAIVVMLLRRKRTGSKTAQAAKTGISTVTESTKGTAIQEAQKKKAITESTADEQKGGFCAKCGAPVEKDAVFCKKCGSKLT